ncbi:hypothetical protein DVDV_4049 [Desulfovibrio sp. DV]|nr:hypothetical protein DVDV_4049 [Desulfovibrio sp. DV]
MRLPDGPVEPGEFAVPPHDQGEDHTRHGQRLPELRIVKALLEGDGHPLLDDRLGLFLGQGIDGLLEQRSQLRLVIPAGHGQVQLGIQAAGDLEIAEMVLGDDLAYGRHGVDVAIEFAVGHQPQAFGNARHFHQVHIGVFSPQNVQAGVAVDHAKGLAGQPGRVVDKRRFGPGGHDHGKPQIGRGKTQVAPAFLGFPGSSQEIAAPGAHGGQALAPGTRRHKHHGHTQALAHKIQKIGGYPDMAAVFVDALDGRPIRVHAVRQGFLAAEVLALPVGQGHAGAGIGRFAHDLGSPRADRLGYGFGDRQPLAQKCGLFGVVHRSLGFLQNGGKKRPVLAHQGKDLEIVVELAGNLDVGQSCPTNGIGGHGQIFHRGVGLADRYHGQGLAGVLGRDQNDVLALVPDIFVSRAAVAGSHPLAGQGIQGIGGHIIAAHDRQGKAEERPHKKRVIGPVRRLARTVDHVDVPVAQGIEDLLEIMAVADQDELEGQTGLLGNQIKIVVKKPLQTAVFIDGQWPPVRVAEPDDRMGFDKGFFFRREGKGR